MSERPNIIARGRPRFGAYQSTTGTLARLGVIGRVYSRLVGYTQVGGYGRFIVCGNAIAQHARLTPMSSVLDLGCGAGDMALYLAQKYRCVVVGTDRDPNVLDTLRSRAQSLGMGRHIHTLAVSHEAISSTCSYNLAISVDSLQYSTSKRDVLARLYRALVPGGTFILCMPSSSGPAKQASYFLPRHLFTDHEQVEGWRDNPAVEHFSLSTIREALIEAGFEISDARHPGGRLGRVAWEFSHVLRVHAPVVLAFALPILKALAWIDANTKHPRGAGILVVARKPGATV
jgi:ubiquinone/menaquinone biosynthesis C-methylase UbiE